MARKYPHITTRGFIHPEEDRSQRELYRGHPTSPGPRDAYVAKAGRQDVADGSPGVPRIWPTPYTHSDAAGKEIEVWYDGPTLDNPQLS